MENVCQVLFVWDVLGREKGAGDWLGGLQGIVVKTGNYFLRGCEDCIIGVWVLFHILHSIIT